MDHVESISEDNLRERFQNRERRHRPPTRFDGHGRRVEFVSWESTRFNNWRTSYILWSAVRSRPAVCSPETLVGPFAIDALASATNFREIWVQRDSWGLVT